ncbi:MAG: hypothetical protein QM800_06540 [Paludibacter sp.]
MKSHPTATLAAIGAVAAMTLGSSATTQAADNSCDRVCLVKIADQYLTALVNSKPTDAPLAANVVFNENGKPARLGEGSWQAAKGVRPQRQHAADVANGQIAMMTVLDGRNDQFQELAIRLKVSGGKITEIESLWTQDGQAGPVWYPQALLYREAPFVRTLPAKSYTSRENLKKIVDQFWDVSTGSHDGYTLPYASDCQHYENGTNVGWEQELSARHLDSIKEDPVRNGYIPDSETGMYWTCARSIKLSTASWNKATDRNYVIDDERGVVISFVKVDTGGGAAPPAGAGMAAGAAPPAEGGMAAAPQVSTPEVINPLRPVQIGTTIAGSGWTGTGGPSGMSTKSNNAALRNATIYQAQSTWVVAGKIKRESAYYYITPKAP